MRHRTIVWVRENERFCRKIKNNSHLMRNRPLETIMIELIINLWQATHNPKPSYTSYTSFGFSSLASKTLS